jgi:hypothetical protein
LANHNFSATIQPDPINQCDYLLDILLICKFNLSKSII